MILGLGPATCVQPESGKEFSKQKFGSLLCASQTTCFTFYIDRERQTKLELKSFAGDPKQKCGFEKGLKGLKRFEKGLKRVWKVWKVWNWWVWKGLKRFEKVWKVWKKGFEKVWKVWKGLKGLKKRVWKGFERFERFETIRAPTSKSAQIWQGF